MNLTGANLLIIWSNKQNCLPHLGVYFSHSTVPVLNLTLQDYISNTIIMNYNHVFRTHLHFLYSPPPLKFLRLPLSHTVYGTYIRPLFYILCLFFIQALNPCPNCPQPPHQTWRIFLQPQTGEDSAFTGYLFVPNS